jgi:general secretion pathway protein G
LTANFWLKQDSGVARRTKNQINGSIRKYARESRWPVRRSLRWKNTPWGFTIIELMITMAIIAILASMASLAFAAYRERAQITRAVADIHTIQNAITSFQIVEGQLPVDLAEVNWDAHNDPWGNPYQYTNFETVPKGKWRKDKFLVPINSTYDLWSMGPDGESLAPLVTPVSKDDIIRANDGLFIGRASLY